MKETSFLFLGFLLIFVGIFLVLISLFKSSSKVKVEWAVGGFVGPIPFGFATKSWLLWLIILILFIYATLTTFGRLS